ncbi:MAG: 16S rRNA (adenine(1518)-N(6)/adenine(1519)-N(6))-dimethyltransferase RsmA [Acidobacteriota bacterium]
MAPGRPSLKKTFGQHHLVDGALCRPLIEFLSPIAGARVLEIGPGGGVLTAELLRAGAEVLAWEVDPEWAFALRSRFGRGSGCLLAPSGAFGSGQSLRDNLSHDLPKLSIVAGDALEIPWERLPDPTLVAGNLPYNVATPLIERILTRAAAVPRAAVLVQYEVAERLVAGPGDEAYGSMSVLVAAYAHAHLLGQVKKGSFRPPPKVDGGFVGFNLRPPPLPPAEMPAFIAMVRLAFGQRRKTLKNALAAGWGKERAAAVLDAAGIDPGLRAEALGLGEFLAIHQVPIPARYPPDS